MDVAVGIERLTALVFVLTGISHLAAPRAWARFFVALRDRSAVPGFAIAFVHAPLGLLILAFHWTWAWPQAVVTFIGCALTLKGLIYLALPSVAARTLRDVGEDRPGGFRAAGLLALAIGLWIGWISLGAPGR